jgi:hypothetical protein
MGGYLTTRRSGIIGVSTALPEEEYRRGHAITPAIASISTDASLSQSLKLRQLELQYC